MSIVTNYNINGIDLGNIFQQYTPITLTNISSNSSLGLLATNNDGTILYSGSSVNTTFLKSTNSGQTWIGTNVNITITSISTNSTGQYILIFGPGASYDYFYGISNNYGTSFTYFATNLMLPSTMYYSTCMSLNGKYMFVLTNNLLFSNDYGVTWNIIVTSNTFNDGIQSIICNSSGNIVYYSSDQGLYSLTTNTTEPYTYTSYIKQTIILQNTLTNTYYIPLSVNSLGDIIYVSEYNSSLTTIIKYSNYGQNYITLTNQLPSFTSGMFVLVLCDSLGQKLLLTCTNYFNLSSLTGFNYHSTNYGANWSQLLGSAGTAVTQSCVNFSKDASYFYYVSNNYLNKYLFLNTLTTNYLLTNGSDLGTLFSNTIAIQGTSAFNIISQLTGYNSLVNSVSTDIGKLISPIYNIYTNGTSLTTSSQCKYIVAILIGGGGGGGSGGANNSPSGASGAGGGGGGGGISIISINNVNLGTAMTITYSIGAGGTGGAVLTTNKVGNSGNVGGNTNLTYNGITYTVGGGGGGSGGGGLSTNPNIGGSGGIGGINITSNFLLSYQGQSGSNGMSKVASPQQTTRVMGGVGGLSGNYNTTITVPTPANTVPTPTITYTINSQNIINDSVISLINATNISQNGSGLNSAPTVVHNTYYGQGGYGGDSNINTSTDYGFAGSNGQQGCLIICQYVK